MELADLHSPNKAINKDVFPDPVGPTMMLIWPWGKVKSFSIRSINFRFDGVRAPCALSDQVNEAAWKPMSFEWAIEISEVGLKDCFPSVNWSKSSVCATQVS